MIKGKHMPKTENGKWYNKDEAAEIEDISVRQLQRRVKAGRYVTKQVRCKFGQKLMVYLPVDKKQQQIAEAKGGTSSKKSIGILRSDKRIEKAQDNAHDNARTEPAITQVNPMTQVTHMPTTKVSVVSRDDNVRGCKVLVVDDDLEFVQELCKILKQANDRVEIIIANNGGEGIEKMKSELPDLIVSEIGLLEGDGFEMAKAKDADDVLKDIPLVWLSYLKESLIIERGLGFKSVRGFFAKPLIDENLSRFSEFVRQILNT